MGRSAKKGPYIYDRLLAKVKKASNDRRTPIKTWARAATITPAMVGYTFGVHNGKQHISVVVVENMVGHKLGEFAATRKFTRHGGRLSREQEQAAVPKPAGTPPPKTDASKKK